MGKRTQLYDAHVAAGARMVDFSGWDMPVHYGSQIEEHQAVRRSVGMFDVSHMTVVDLHGKDAKAYLRHLLANDVDKLAEPGKALYSAMLNPDGGVIDDLIVYLMSPAADRYRVVVNCGTRDKDLAWMQEQVAGRDVELRERPDLAMLAVQGPAARERTASVLGGEPAAMIGELKVFQAAVSGDWFIARTGYTGEDGLEIILPGGMAAEFWEHLLEQDVRPCGLGARDTLRLEAGMNLYGQDMDETVTPLESNMGWTVAWEPAEREFIGRAALEEQRARGGCRQLRGLLLEGRGVLRSHQKVVFPGQSELAGETTSGTFSPTLQRAIGLARLPAGCGNSCAVEIRGKLLPARIVKPCFVRNGRSVVEN